VLQRLLHGDERLTFALADIVDRADIGLSRSAEWVKPRCTLVLDGDVLPAERMPAEAGEVESQPVGRWTNEAPENHAVVEGFAAVLKGVIIAPGFVCLNRR
jgi:hypothetical protein